jgi:hypothetical protein
MTQLSRPFQIVIVAFAFFVLVWFVALRGHSPSTSSGSGASAPAASAAAPAAPSGAAEAQKAAAPTRVYHGAAPGVEGLTRAINKAHGAVAQSQQDAKRFEKAEPSGASATSGETAAAASSHTSTAAAKAAPAPVKRSAPAAAKSHAATPAAASSMQTVVERELHEGKTVLILFWSRHGADDVAVHQQLQAAAHALGGKVAVHEAAAGQVGAFGAITHTIQVYQTPTLLVVNTHGQATTITGLTDAFSIEQAVSESRQSA